MVTNEKQPFPVALVVDKKFIQSLADAEKHKRNAPIKEADVNIAQMAF